jgi:hypothetical protein
MTDNRANWVETFTSFVQFYPNLTRAIAFATIAAAGRMVSSTPSGVGAFNRSEPIARISRATPAKPSKTAKRKKRKAARH